MNKDLEANVTAEFTDAGDLKDLHGALLSTQSVEQFLHEMAVLAARLVGGGLSCGMTMQPNGRPVTVACSDPVANLGLRRAANIIHACVGAAQGRRPVSCRRFAAPMQDPEVKLKAASVRAKLLDSWMRWTKGPW